MKLRQNKNQEIDLRTIADAELDNQINCMLPLDGSKKMTGILETVGSHGTQIELGDGGTIVNYNGTPVLATNCYVGDDGTWRYSSDGGARIVFAALSLNALNYSDALVGKKGELVVWRLSNLNFLTDQTGVKKSGDTMTGNLDVNGRITTRDVVGGNYGWMDVSTAGTIRIIAVGESETAGNVGVLLNKGWDNRNAIRFFREGSAYSIYGEHNPQIVRADYIGDGQTNRVITLPFTPRGVILIDGLEFRGAIFTDYGIIVSGNANTIGRGYMVFAFK